MDMNDSKRPPTALPSSSSFFEEIEQLKNTYRSYHFSSEYEKEKLPAPVSKVTNQPSLKDMPPEMLCEILKCLTTPELLQTRQVNRTWNKLCSTLLGYRPETQLQFQFDPPLALEPEFCHHPPLKEAYSQIIRWNLAHKTGSRRLNQLTFCSKNSTNFPFAHFKLSDLDQTRKEMIDFLKECGQHIMSIEIEKIENERDLYDLSSLLTIHAPNIQQLSLSQVNTSSLPLFQQIANQPSVQLVCLKTLSVSNNYQSYGNALESILTAAIKLESIHGPWENVEYPKTHGVSVGDLEFWNSVDKLGSLKSLAVCLSDDKLAKYWEKNENGIIKKLNLTTLKLSLGSFEGQNPDFKSEICVRASEFLSRLTEHVKDSLLELELQPLGGFLDKINWSHFNTVKKLVLCDSSTSQPFFPRRIRQIEIFPRLTELYIKGRFDTKHKDIFPTLDSIPILTNVQILRIKMPLCKSPFVQSVALMCPNVRGLTLDNFQSFHVMGEAIFVNMTQLNSLTMSMLPCPDDDTYMIPLVSIFTGYSKETSKKVLNHIRANANIQEFSATSSGPRENTSVYDLTDLQRLKIIVETLGAEEIVNRMQILLSRLFTLQHQHKPELQVTIEKELV